ncbi:S1C family serine protease [Paenibacillus gorillae]|uniref:S1C family serine protease n=1 Tax=Paenibacillus gorillae TaxID=1243662 RepID=UPI0004AE4B9A|nr:trypsin-like peptidase domain-containing protein [Paenibacillus gorillae]
MDDQNKKNGFDDFFQNPENSEKTVDKTEGTERAESSGQSGSPEQQDGASKTSYYYSYGPYRPGAQDESSTSPSQSPYSSNPSEPAFNKPQENPSYASAAAGSTAGVQSQQQYTGEPIQAANDRAEVTQPPALRSFTSNQQSAKGNWQVREPKRGTSFRSMFISFLAGVLVVGGLMYTSDRQNWFTQGTQAMAPGQTNESSNGQTASNGGSSPVTAAARPDNISTLFKTASPAVVKIETYVKPSRNNSGGGFLDDPFFRQFFGDDYPGTKPQDKGNDSDLQASGIGTGFFFDSTGYILTNQHVVGNSDKIEVTVQGYDKPFTAELLGSDYQLDLAVLKVTGEKAFPTLPLGSSDNINIGDWVVAIGNPYGFDHTVTVGVLSAKERPIDIPDSQGTRNYEHLLQTDASINPGNSGGPLLNVNGEVVGINTAVSSQAQGIGFAIPTSTIQNVLNDLKNNKEVPKTPVPFIGAGLADVTEDIAKQLGLEKAEGSIVSNVYYNSPAYLADLKQYDIILGIDGKAYNSTQQLIKQIQTKKVGDKIELNIIRRGEKMNVPVEIGDKNKFNAE